MSSRVNTASTAWILGSLFFLACLPPSLTQTVKLSVRDQSNNRFVFNGETNIELICEYSGFSNVPSVEITHEGTAIAQGSNSLSSNYTIQVDGNFAVILTIKMASEYTRGLYTCLVSDNDLGLTKSTNFNFEVLTLVMGPRCWSSLPTEGGIYTGQSFSADCFYFDSNDVFESEWIQLSRNGTETPVTSTETVLPGKKKQTITVPSVTNKDDGVLYKCRVNHKTTMLIRLTPCEIGPVIVSPMTTPVSTSSYVTPLLSESIEGEQETTILTSRRPKVKVTEDLQQESPLGGLLIYIIIGVGIALVVFALIAILICICVCSCRSKKSKVPKVAQKDPEKVSNVYTTDEKSQPSWVYDTSPIEVKLGSPVYDLPPAFRNDDYTIGLQSPGNQSPEEVEYHNIGLSLDENNIQPFVPSQTEMSSTHL
uniref:Ig-like domain-containing protein n=1 Tax=Holothuria leucospilota TaxID=206669 RepID=A0A9Q1BQR1_HOLLE|nr:hypothetical protein HOLleu_27431 [Holothuria leucospilota]